MFTVVLGPVFTLCNWASGEIINLLGVLKVLRKSDTLYLLKKLLHEAIPALDVDSNVVGTNIVVVALGLK